MATRESMLKVGDIVRVVKFDVNPRWIGCLFQVEEVKTYGCLGVQVTYNGNIYLTLNSEEFEIVGWAPLPTMAD